MPENQEAAIEQERLFGKDVDLFKAYHAVLNIGNILKTIGVQTSSNNDWFRAVAQYMTVAELTSLYDRIISPEHRQALAEQPRHRNPPILREDDPDDILSYLSKNIVHRKKMWRIASSIYQRKAKQYKAALEETDRRRSALETRVHEMQELFSLTDLEIRALITIFLSETNFINLGDFDVGNYNSGEKICSMARILDITEIEASELFNDDHNIRKYGLIDEDMDMDRTFLSYLVGISSKPLAERFWTKYSGEVLPWEFHGRLAEKNGAVLKDMIRSKSPDAGLSVLFFGVPGSGKTSFAASLAADMGKELYFIAQNDNDSHNMRYSAAFRYAALAVAQKQLDPATSILVIDECDKLVENTSMGGEIFYRLFGGNIAAGRDGESKGQLNTVIDQNRHVILWICNSKQEAIDPSSRRRFDYNIFFDDLSAGSRRHIWENALKFYNCQTWPGEEFLTRLSRRYPVNPGGISISVKNAVALCKADPSRSFEKELMTFLKAHCSLLGIQEAPEELLEPARDYSLEGLNIRSGIKLPRLIEACRKYLNSISEIGKERDQPRMNLLLFGAPGSGKTEFVKYLAKQLDRKLCIKNASDLLDCYVGATEQRIAAAFAEAELSQEILFIDEGDSLLSTRENAIRSWEVSQVNTLLTEMEHFRGIFIVGTNLIQRLDQAALRRFSFRLHFDYLNNEGKEIFYKTYFTRPFGLPELSGKEREALFSIDTMTPSDFRNTRQQFYYLEDSNLSNAEIIEALASEIAGKNAGSSFKGLGNIVNKMGF
ncbi:ATP-binding protein [uncultured Victivallis sp.]|uniref:AAA family ATPase n=1 Tax=uncultured Victivallis sp. TaxID=354118 RepID=UPI0025F48689|nr:ATP-binding protein [uncultured Victivallis sp.]